MASCPDDNREVFADRALAYFAVAFAALAFGVPTLLAVLR